MCELGGATIGLCIALLAMAGCRATNPRLADSAPAPATAAPPQVAEATQPQPQVTKTAFVEDSPSDADSVGDPQDLPLQLPAITFEEVPAPDPQPLLTLESVVQSVRSNFPLIEQASAARVIASGEALSAAGAFDHKVEGYSEAQPLDFYENYRSKIGVKRDTTWGGQTFAGYRVGRGDFEPWYLERETNRGGEFKAGFMAPVVRDRWIDSNRAALWQAQLERRRVEPEIMAQVLRFVRDGSIAYWAWVAAGANEQVATQLLELAVERNEGLEAQVAATEKAPITLKDNRRIIVSREAKLIDAQRKLQQSAIKLSLFYRSVDGAPSLPPSSLLPPRLPLPQEAGRPRRRRYDDCPGAAPGTCRAASGASTVRCRAPPSAQRDPLERGRGPAGGSGRGLPHQFQA